MAKNQIKCRASKRNQKVHKLFTVTGLVFLLLIHVSVLSEAATLNERLISTWESTRDLAREELSKLDPEARKGLVPPLIKALKDENRTVRRGAAKALGEIGPEAKEAIPALIETLKDNVTGDDTGVHYAAITALGKMGPEAIPSLIKTLKDEDEGIRWYAARALGKIGPEAKEAVPALNVMEGEAWAVEQALRKIGPATKEAVPALIEALKDKDKSVRYRAALALGEIGPEAKEAVPALIMVLKDWNGFQGSFAITALGKIGPTEETVPINENLGDIFYESQNWDDALNFYTEAMRLNPQNALLKEKIRRCRQIAKLEKERVAEGLVVYKDKSSKNIKVRYRTSGFSLLSRLSKEKLIDRGRMAVVTILAGDRQGSGFLISNDGYLLTNEHVVGGARFVKAKFLMGRQVSGEVIRINKFKDVALVKLERGTYPYLPVGDSSKINVGKEVYAIGTPLSEKLSHTVTKGIVSSFRVIDGNRYIQSDVSVHPGNSGGPLISIGNGVVGICVSGIGFGPITLGLNLFIPIKEAISSLEIARN